jgi:hypothetical protein
LWSLQWGSKIDFLQQVAKDTGELPPALANRPSLTVWQYYFWEAYHIVSNSRSFHSAGVAGIPLSQILAYFEIYDIKDLELRNLYLYHIQRLDSAYLEYTSKKS